MWFWIFNIAGIGRIKIKALIDGLGSAKKVYAADMEKLLSVQGISHTDALRIEESKRDPSIYERAVRMERLGVSMIHMWSEDYPYRLRHIYDAPAVLYYRGVLPDKDKPVAAIVGSRNCTAYGRHMAYEIAKGLSAAGWLVISGMAAGIDSSAHRACIELSNYTCAVLGCGADICYPRSNIDIYDAMVKRGCIISEYTTGTPPHPGQFPVRNRIISGLADVVIVVEARKKSGSLITVEHALEQGKSIYAVPGRADDVLSEGCNWLIKMGAGLITDASDIDILCDKKAALLIKRVADKNERHGIEQAVVEQTTMEQTTMEQTGMESTDMNKVYDCISWEPKSLDVIMEETELDITVVNEQLLSLQLEGLVWEIAKNCYCRL